MLVDDKQARETLISQLRQFESLDENDILRDAADLIESLSAQLERVERETIRLCAQIAFDKQMDDDGSDWSEGWNDACTALYNIISGLPSAKTATETE